MALDAAMKAGMNPENLVDMELALPGSVFERAIAKIGKQGTIFGMGNIGGGGNEIIEYFQNRAYVPDDEAEEQEEEKEEV